jgi:enoyl-CoA hydratase
MLSFDHLRTEAADGILTIIIDRPDKLNALSGRTLEEIEVALADALGNREVGGLVITGAGPRSFVAGADIAELARMSPLGALEVSRLGQRVFRKLELARKPVVAAVNGFALGGGCELALACHLRVASRNARFGLPETRLGIIPGYGGTVRLPRLVGKGRALELILTGEPIDAERAYQIGLVNRLTEPDSLLEEARSLLRAILGNGPTALSFAIESVTRGQEMGLDQALELEANLFGLLAATDDMREGMTAFLEKRKPDFTGR